MTNVHVDRVNCVSVVFILGDVQRTHIGERSIYLGRLLMAKEFSKAFYKSVAWQKCRAYCWSRDKGLCQDCLKNGMIVPGVEVHHIVELTPQNISDSSISLNPSNLVTLCKSCHEARHGRVLRRFKVDELGRVIDSK